MASATRGERLDLRVPAELKRTIERAATLSGETVSGFVLGVALRRARRVIRESEVIELSDRDRDRLLAALDDADARPTPALRRAVARHKALTD
jgi:uncharacterized protein (DUF1778 family)